MNSSKFGCNCPKLGCIKSAMLIDLSEKDKQKQQSQIDVYYFVENK